MKVLMVGAYGQVARELYRGLAKKLGTEAVVCCDLKPPPKDLGVAQYEIFNVLDKQELYRAVKKHGITQIYCMAGQVSAQAELNPLLTERNNMHSLMNCLEACRELKLSRLFWPSSAAAFGSEAPHDLAPQEACMNPESVSGITSRTGELWCGYYWHKFGVDVRSIRYPAFAAHTLRQNGAPYDYVSQALKRALNNEAFECGVGENTEFAMIDSEDAVRATIELMEAEPEQLSVHTSYNVNGMTASPKKLTELIRRYKPAFSINYRVDPAKQRFFQNWPKRLDDSVAREDWGWQPNF